MEGRVYPCTWKKAGARYRVWVTARPKIAAEGETFAEADEALWTAIITATGDGENNREYSPPAPVGDELAAFLKPALVMPIGETRAPAEPGVLYAGAPCTSCGGYSGGRTDAPLVAPDLESGFDAGVVVVKQPPFVNVNRYVYTAEFLALLRPAERARFTLRKAERPGRAKRVWHELLDAELILEDVAVTGLKHQGGWRCDACGFRYLPQYVSYEWPMHWVSADAVKDIPTCFAVRDGRDIAMGMTAKRWAEMKKRGAKGTRGILAHDIGVAPVNRIDKAPQLRSIADIAKAMAGQRAL